VSRWPEAPPGFRRFAADHSAFFAAIANQDPLLAADLDRVETWQRRLGERAAASAGRGQSTVLRVDGGPRLRLKALRRGGLARGLWAERFVGARRLIENLRIPSEAIRRGVATPPAEALLLVEGPPQLFRGWLATVELAGAKDLASRLAGGPPPSADELSAVMKAVRIAHDAGLEHRDLNLGNLLLTAEPKGWLIDLDGARLHTEPLSVAARRRALRRLVRSLHKLRFRTGGAGDSDPEHWLDLYAEGEFALRAGLARFRGADRLRIRLHRLGWRR
jgi:hypothetical protein